MSALHGWHHGERSMHQKMGFADKVSTHYTAIQGDLPPEHGRFYATCLPFLPVTTLDGSGRPWGSVLAGKDGRKGFVSDSRYTKLNVKAQLWDGDPLEENLQQFGKEANMLVAGIGVEFPTRRRNKFAGVISKLERVNQTLEMEFFVNQAIGNCPKYINVRDLEPRGDRKPTVIHRANTLSTEDRLPDDVVQFILSSDTVFLGTSYVAKPEDADRYPSHLGMNHRGGLPGFVRVRKDGRTVVLPDYSGNRLMTSLGNIETTPLASLTFVNFMTGDILYLTGDAKNLVGPEAHALIPFQHAVTAIYMTGFIFVSDVLPVKQKEGTMHQASPYSPPVRLLAEEAEITLFENEDKPEAALTRVELHDPHTATFTWQSSKNLLIQPGQAIILDCSSLIGARQYQHMSPLDPSSVNDDRIRTWTVSSASSGPTRIFSLTVRHKPDLLRDMRPLQLTVNVAGVTGQFVLPPGPRSITDRELGFALPPTPAPSRRDLIWFAGGIGLTPFLSMLNSLGETVEDEQVNIHFILSTREPHILLPLVFKSLDASSNHTNDSISAVTMRFNPNIHISFDVFCSKYQGEAVQAPSGIRMEQHARRLDPAFIEARSSDFVGKDVFVCGPEDYTGLIVGALAKIGVDQERIRTEGFTY